jgi:pimeloyl-ACP methyl ester carboxylesterase
MTLRPIKKWKRWITLFLVIYITGGVAFYFFQDKLLFHPEPLKAGEPYHFKQPHREINIPLNKESNMNLVLFSNTDTVRRGIVLYFHGNMKNISRYADYAPYFTNNGYEVLMVDYPGYGKSTGEFTEKNLYDFAAQAYKFAQSRFPSDSIIIYGKSMGTGIAARVAYSRSCKRLILETPYYSMTSLAERYFFMYPVDLLLHYKIPTGKYLQKVYAPITIFHGTDDGVIPYSNALKLKDCLKKGDEFVTIKNAGHNDCYTFGETVRKLDSLLR